MSHAGAHYREIIAYDDTVKIVKEFIDKHPNTLMISVSDHETGTSNAFPLSLWYYVV